MTPQHRNDTSAFVVRANGQRPVWVALAAGLAALALGFGLWRAGAGDTGSIGVAAAVPIAPALAAPAPFRFGIPGPTTAPCAPAAADGPLAAYTAHLAQRLERPVLVCPLASRTEAAAALEAKSVDMALLDTAAIAPHRTSLRALMMPRGHGGLGRVETVALTLTTATGTGLGALAGAKVGYAGAARFAQAEPQRALADQGVSAADLAADLITDGPEQGFAALRAGQIDVLVLHTAARERVCRRSSAEDRPCADIKELWRGRPRAETAYSVRRDMDRELRFRLIGIHVALHLENPAAFAAIAPGAPELEPTEADALVLGIAP